MPANDPTLRVDDTHTAGSLRRSEVLLARGAEFGRYVVLGRVGSGGAGDVYAAYDGSLDRRIALKILQDHPHRAATDPASADEGWTRLVHEAQTLAKLNHPNVVTVHDVGEVAGRTFIAMELVDGSDLSDWLEHEAKSRPWQERLQLALMAGRGLAAAHAAGIVHRDFKPGNVLVGKDGRARVSDFGIAAPMDATQGDREATDDDDDATITGTRSRPIPGTPYYLAPEQHDGQDADFASDLYGFCVTLYELMYLARPWEPQTIHALALRKFEGPPSPPRNAPRLPGWLHRAIARGLAPKPAQRWASMQELLRALDRHRSGVRRNGIGIAAFAAIGGGLIGAYAMREPEAPDPCANADRHLATVWNEARSDAVRAGLSSVDVPMATAAADRAAAGLSSYAQQWTTARRDACVASHGGEQSPALLDRRLACLDRAAARLDKTAQILETADAAVVVRVPNLLQLPPVSQCSDAGALLAEVPPPDDAGAAATVQALRVRLEHHLALTVAGRFDVARTEIEDAMPAVREVGYPALTAEAELYLGVLETRVDRHERALVHLQSAHFTAEAAHHDRVATRAASRILTTLSAHVTRLDEATSWAPHARSAALRTGDAEHEVEFLIAMGWLNHAKGEYAAARVDLARAVALAEAELPTTSMVLADALTTFGAVLDQLAESKLALEHHRRALAIIRGIYGDAHPNAALTMGAIGISLYSMGDHAGALTEFRRELSVLQTSLGDHHAETAAARIHLGAALAESGALDEAREHMVAARDILIETNGETSADALDAIANVGRVDLRRAAWDDAASALRRAMPGIAAARGDKHESYASVVVDLGNAERERGNTAVALKLQTKGVAIYDAALGESHPETVRAHASLGLTLEAAGDRDAARTEITWALARYTDDRFGAAEIADIQAASERLAGD